MIIKQTHNNNYNESLKQASKRDNPRQQHQTTLNKQHTTNNIQQR